MESPFDKIRALLETGEIKEGISLLTREIPDTRSDFKNAASTLLSRLNEAEKESRTGLMSSTDFSVAKSKIVHDTLLLAGELENMDDVEIPIFDTGHKSQNPSKSYGKNSVVLEHVKNEGKLTINYNKNVVQVVLIVIALMLLGGYFLWPELQVYVDSNKQGSKPSSVVSHSYVIEQSSAKVLPPFMRVDFKSNGLAVIHPSISFGPNTTTPQTRKYTESDDIVLLDLPLFNLTFTKLENDHLLLPYLGNELVYIKSE